MPVATRSRLAVAVHVGAGDAEDAGGVREHLRREMARSVAEQQDELPCGSDDLGDTEIDETVAVQIAQSRHEPVGCRLTGRDVDGGDESAAAVAKHHGNVVGKRRGRCKRCRDVRAPVPVEVADRKPAGIRVQRNRSTGGEAACAVAKQNPELPARRLTVGNRRDGEVRLCRRH